MAGNVLRVPGRNLEAISKFAGRLCSPVCFEAMCGEQAARFAAHIDAKHLQEVRELRRRQRTDAGIKSLIAGFRGPRGELIFVGAGIAVIGHATAAWLIDPEGKSDSDRATPISDAKASSAGRRHDGMRPLVFQLETVDGVSESAAATALVPPRRSMMSVAVCISFDYDNRNFPASRKLRCP